ncbi:MAG: PadR family transcriptional regulator [Thermoplasmata archaeon]
MKERSRMMKGLISILILKELYTSPLHGYAIQRRISEKIGNDLPPGMIYVILKSLERKGCIESQEGRGEHGKNIKIYHITEHGRDFLLSHRDQLSTMRVLIDDILQTIGKD